MVLGVAGRYCAGKDAVLLILKNEGFSEINMDALGHKALEEKKEIILEHFGPSIFNARGEIDRKALGKIVFSDPFELKTLESIVHPWMYGQTEQILRTGTASKWVINAALLFHMNLDRLCDAVLWVTAPLFVRIRRGLRRDKLGIRVILKRIWAQRGLKPQNSGNHVDIYRVENRGTREALERRIRSLLKAKGL